MSLDATVEKIEKLEKTLNSTVTKVTNLGISTILLKLSDEINYLQNAIRWLRNSITQLVYTNKLPGNLLNEEEMKTEIELVAKKVINKNQKLLTKNPYLMESTVGYDDTKHILYIILKAPITIEDNACKTVLLNKFVVAKIKNSPKIMEIESPKSYYERTIAGKRWYATTARHTDESVKVPHIWRTHKPGCLNALEEANNTKIFKSCHFKETTDSVKVESISKNVLC